MTKQELAEQLNGNPYGGEVTIATRNKAKEAGLVIVFGASDDLLELRGAINDEFGCYDGGIVYLDRQGILKECGCNCIHYKKARSTAESIRALWCKEKPYSWTYLTDIPHASFDIMDDGEKYCRGIIFSIHDIRE